MKKKKVTKETKAPLNSILAWMIVNYITEGGLRMPKTELNDEFIGEKDPAKSEKLNPMRTFDKLFFNTKVRVNYSFSSQHAVMYEFLRPEIITQFPQILCC